MHTLMLGQVFVEGKYGSTKPCFRKLTITEKLVVVSYWKGSPCETTGGVLIGTPCRPRARVSRTRGFGERSRDNCGCIRAVAVLGFAKASDGASARNNAMEIVSVII